MLPGVDGFQVVTELRRTRRFVPVLMLTARGRSEDVLKGFEAGADDYLPKPFELPILLARLNGLLRRSNWHKSAQRSEEHTSELQSHVNLVCRLLLEKKKNKIFSGTVAGLKVQQPY